MCDVIPAPKAGRIAAIAGLTDPSGWAPVRPEDGVKVGAAYAPEGDRIALIDSFPSAADEDPGTRRHTWRESVDRYRAITAEIFG